MYEANRLAQSSVLCLIVRSDCSNSRIYGQTGSSSQLSANTKWEFPRLCPGGSRTLRFPGVFHLFLLLSFAKQMVR